MNEIEISLSKEKFKKMQENFETEIKKYLIDKGIFEENDFKKIRLKWKPI